MGVYIQSPIKEPSNDAFISQHKLSSYLYFKYIMQ